jgi:hypothetical protein
MSRTTDPAKIQLWQSRFKHFENSKLSIERYCVSVDCCLATFYYWKRKLAGTSQKSAVTRAKNKGSRTFVPVLVRTSQSQSVIVLLSDGTKIELQCDAISALHAVLQDAKKAS